jgi:hypothetical protein
VTVNGIAAKTTLNVKASYLNIGSIIGIIFQPQAIFLGNATPSSGDRTPYLMKQGTQVLIGGGGLKNGLQVQFGNASAKVAPVAVASDGTWVTAHVPQLATSGKITVLQGGQSYSSTDAVTIDNWRSTNGYSFCNTDSFQKMVGGYSIDDLTEVFGFDQTHLNIFGWRPVDPLAEAFLWIANQALQDGQCFGFSVSSLRFQAGQRRLTDFPSTGGGDVWHLNGAQMSSGNNVSPKLSHFVHLTHVQQFSAEFLAAWLGSWNVLGHKDTFHSQVKSALAGTTGGIITLAGSCGHAVQAYNMTDNPDGSFDVWVYDPNVPYTDGESDGSRTNESRVHVAANGQFMYDDGPGNGAKCGGGLDQVHALPLSSAPTSPHIPTLQGALSAIGHAIGSAHVAQVTDAAGKTLLAGDGSPNRDNGTRMPGSGVFHALGGRHGAGAPVFLLGSKGPYTYAMAGKSAGDYSLQVVGKEFAARLDKVQIAAGARDELVVDHGAASVQFKTAAPQKPVNVHLVARGADGHARTAVLSTVGHANAPFKLAFDAKRENLVYRHAGAPASFSLKLTAAGADKKLHTLQLAPAQVEKGDEITFQPNWKELEKGGSLSVKKAAGNVLQKPLK